MFAGVRLQFGPIDSHMPELDQARLVAQPQSLGEQLRQTLQMRLPKAGDRIVIGVLVRRQVPERYVFMGRSFDLPRTNPSPAVAVQQHSHHHRRVVGRHSSSILTSVDRHDLGQVQFVGYLGDEARQMILRQPVLQRRREKEDLVQIAGAEALAHTTSVPDSGTFPYKNVPLCSSPGPPERIYLRQTPRNPSQAPLPAGFRETGRGGQLFPNGSSAALLVIRGYINRNRPSRIGSPDRRAQAYSRRPAWETDHGLRIQNLASMVFISSFGDYPVFNGLVRSLVLMEQFWSRVPAHAGSVSTFSDDGLE